MDFNDVCPSILFTYYAEYNFNKYSYHFSDDLKTTLSKKDDVLRHEFVPTFFTILIISAVIIFLLYAITDEWNPSGYPNKWQSGRGCPNAGRRGRYSYEGVEFPDLETLLRKDRNCLRHLGKARVQRSALLMRGGDESSSSSRHGSGLLRRNYVKRVAYPSAFGSVKSTSRLMHIRRSQQSGSLSAWQDYLCTKCYEYAREESCMHEMCYKCCYECPSLYLGYRSNKQYSNHPSLSRAIGCREVLADGFTCLDNMDMSGKNLAQVPSKVFVLGHACLRVLNLAENKLTGLPESFELLANLEELYLQDNQLQKLPDSICSIKTLTDVDLSYNELYTLPTDIGTMFGLKYLDIAANSLGSLPDSITNLSSLFLLDVNMNYLSRLPEAFGNLRALRVLSASQNKLRSLPGTIGGCINLENLDCSDNLIESLPVELFACHSLTSLYLRNNKLLRVPWQIVNISSSLMDLNLRNNRLHCLPTSIRSMRRINNFDVFDNPLIHLDDSSDDMQHNQRSTVVRKVFGQSDQSSGKVSSLAELSARRVLSSEVSFSTLDVTVDLNDKLTSAEFCHRACGTLTVLQYTALYVSSSVFGHEVTLEERLCPKCSLQSWPTAAATNSTTTTSNSDSSS